MICQLNSVGSVACIVLSIFAFVSTEVAAQTAQAASSGANETAANSTSSHSASVNGTAGGNATAASTTTNGTATTNNTASTIATTITSSAFPLATLPSSGAVLGTYQAPFPAASGGGGGAALGPDDNYIAAAAQMLPGMLPSLPILFTVAVAVLAAAVVL